MNREVDAGRRTYLLAQVIVHDVEEFGTYIHRMPNIIESYGGSVVDVTRATQILEGEWPIGALTALVHFPDADSARRFWAGPANTEMKALRQHTATSHVALCEVMIRT